MNAPTRFAGRLASVATFVLICASAAPALAAPLAIPADLSPMKASPPTATPSKAAPPRQSPSPATDQGVNSVSATQRAAGEPVVQRTVIEDDSSRIEETRVRGQVQRITVTPKGAGKVSYEILPGDGSGSESSRSTAGKRVWNVLQF